MSGYVGGGLARSYMVGQVIDLPYLPARIPKGFAIWDGQVHAIADFPRLFGVIGQTFRKVGDTYDTGTHFRFGGGAVFRKGASYSPEVIAVSSYPLDDDGTLVAPLGYAHLPTTAPAHLAWSNAETGVNGTAVAVRSIALSDAGSTPRTAGVIFGVQHKITAWDAAANVAEKRVLGIVETAGHALAGTIEVGYRTELGVHYAVARVNGIAAATVAGANPAGHSASLYFNGDTGAVHWIAYGVDQGAIPGANLGAGQRVEKRRLAYIRLPSQHHGEPFTKQRALTGFREHVIEPGADRGQLAACIGRLEEVDLLFRKVERGFHEHPQRDHIVDERMDVARERAVERASR